MSARWFSRLALLATLLGVGVVVLGAFVRLSDAGLGCPDWPVCYGKLTWPASEEEIAAANQAFPNRPVEMHKAWKEQVHRFFAATLGALVLGLALLANWSRPFRRWLLVAASLSALLGILTYVQGWPTLAAVFSLLSIGLPLAGALLWRDSWSGRASAGLLALIVFQAMLGMWTVTLLVKPVIVTAHLMGGMATIALLWWITLRNSGWLPAQQAIDHGSWRRGLALAALLVVIVQIALGGWTSSNYAALACIDLPTCHGSWWPEADFAEGFVLWRGLGVDYEFGVLDNPARVAIQLVHRIGAITTLLVVLATALLLARRAAGTVVGVVAAGAGVLVLAQFVLGVSNVLLSLPLSVAVGHNGGAAMLLLVLVTLNYALRARQPGG